MPAYAAQVECGVLLRPRHGRLEHVRFGDDLVEVAGVDRTGRVGEPRGGNGALEMSTAQSFDRDRERPVRQHHADRHFVESDLAVDVRADAHVASEQQQRTGGERMAGARSDHRYADPYTERTRSPPSATRSDIAARSPLSITVRSKPAENLPGRPCSTTAQISSSLSASPIAAATPVIMSIDSAFALPSSR